MISFSLSKVFTGSDSLVNMNKYHWITTKKHHGCRQPSSIVWSHIQLYSSLLADDSLRVERTWMKSMAMLQTKKETVSHSPIMIFAKGAIAFPLFHIYSPRLWGSFNFTLSIFRPTFFLLMSKDRCCRDPHFFKADDVQRPPWAVVLPTMPSVSCRSIPRLQPSASQPQLFNETMVELSDENMKMFGKIDESLMVHYLDS